MTERVRGGAPPIEEFSPCFTTTTKHFARSKSYSPRRADEDPNRHAVMLLLAERKRSCEKRRRERRLRQALVLLGLLLVYCVAIAG